MEYKTIENIISDTLSVYIHPKNKLDCDVTIVMKGQEDLRFPFVAEVIGALGEKFGNEFTQSIIIVVAMSNLKERLDND